MQPCSKYPSKLGAKMVKASLHTLSVLVVSPAATECVGYYLLIQRIAELVVEL